MFHDAPVNRFEILVGKLHVETEEFSTAPGEIAPRARIVITNIDEIYRNHRKVDSFQIESDDAEVYELNSSTGGVKLILIWHFWDATTPDAFVAYSFPRATLSIEALP